MTTPWSVYLSPSVLSCMLLMGLLGCGLDSSVHTRRRLESGSAAIEKAGNEPLSSTSAHAVQGPGWPAESLAVPAWMTTMCQSPNAQLRLQALQEWAQQETIESDDLWLRALNDSDDRVRAQALQLIEQAWARELKELEKRQ